ncbi:hypothetical protein ABZ896_17185 [Streptomyces sp. NPDC047072]|uniref:hypothetical protein n=1 Tax=Streptomyces sp. NPDC047072 TaxID=3154809 RepID=UPI0033D20286
MNDDVPPAGSRSPEPVAPPAHVTRWLGDSAVRAALITGGFGLVPLLVGYLGLSAAVTPPTADMPTVTVTVTETVPLPPSASASKSVSVIPTSDSPSSKDWLKAWERQVTLVSTFTDFDEDPPAHGLSDVKAVGFVDGVYLMATGPGNLAKVAAGSPVPSPVACGSLIDANHDEPNRLPVITGDRVCLRTNLGRIVILAIGTTTVRAADNSSVIAQAVVWTGPETSS